MPLVGEKLISSTIKHSEPIDMPEEQLRIIEVPVIQEKITHVPVKEVHECVQRVPVYEYEFIERIVEIPQIETVQRQIQTEEVREVVKHVPVKQIKEVTKEVIKYVPKVEVRVVEREVQVAGELIEVPQPYPVEKEVIVPRYIDTEVATVVAQRIQPVITESSTEEMEINLREYNPYVVPVDVYIPRPVQRNLIPSGKQEIHEAVDVPLAQYNALVKNLNQHVTAEDTDPLYKRSGNGSIPLLHGPGSDIVPPVSTDFQDYSLPRMTRQSSMTNTNFYQHRSNAEPSRSGRDSSWDHREYR